MIGKGFHLVVFIISGSESETGEEYTGFLLFFDQLDKSCFGRCSDVEISVGAKDDAVISAFYEILLCDLVCLEDSALSVCSAACFEGVDDLLDLTVLVS